MTKTTAHKILKDVPRDQLSNFYWANEMSLGDIAKIYGCSRAVVHKHMKKHRIPLRSLSEARLLAQKKGKLRSIPFYFINDGFLKSWSKEMAYVLGLILTDGCISNTLQSVSLAMNDIVLLEKVRAVMGTNIPVKASKHQPGLYTFTISRKEIVKDLISRGITPRKSLTISFPDVPAIYLSHFIRGVFDGDGSVILHKYSSSAKVNKPVWVTTKFSSASKRFIYELENKLQLLGMPPRKIYIRTSGRRKPFYGLVYGGRDSKKLFEIMYRDTGNGLYLDRKYNIFKKALTYKSRSEKHTCAEKAPEVLKRFFQLHRNNLREFTVTRLAKHIGCSRDTIYRLAKTNASRINPKYIELIKNYINFKLNKTS